MAKRIARKSTMGSLNIHPSMDVAALPLSPLALGALALLVVGAVLAVCGNDRVGWRWGWAALLLLTVLGLLVALKLSAFRPSELRDGRGGDVERSTPPEH